VNAYLRPPFLKAVDQDGTGIGDFIAGLQKDLLPDKFRDDEPFAGIGGNILGVVAGADG